MAEETTGRTPEASDEVSEGHVDPGSVGRQRWSLIVSVVIVLVGLAVSVALLIEAAGDDLPQVPGLNYRVVQAGLVGVALAFSAYAIERERRLRHIAEELEAERRRAERFQAMDEVKNAFLRSISHDLRTPLTVIVGMAGLLEGRGQDLPAERLRDAAGRIGSQARRLDSMLTDLLDVERMARGILRLQAEDLDVAELLREAVEGAEVRDHPIEVLPGPVRATVDQVLVGRIADNLVRNAVKYTPEGTPIWVRVSKDGSEVRLSVEDAGPGVPDELKESIFELFERGGATSGGTGIGLSLVRQFAELHGGRAWVEDRPGGGAAFRVVLAEAPEEQAAEDEEAAG